MIRVFISINLIHKQQTTIKPRKLLKIAALCGVCGENFGILYLEMLHFGADY